MPIQVVFSLVSTGAMIAGFALAGVSGAAWGLCVGSVLKATVLWIRIGTVRTGPPGPGAGSRQAGTPGVHARTAPVGR
jgi:O-antigen/teichoic acid export membrane protein